MMDVITWIRPVTPAGVVQVRVCPITRMWGCTGMGVEVQQIWMVSPALANTLANSLVQSPVQYLGAIPWPHDALVQYPGTVPWYSSLAA